MDIKILVATHKKYVMPKDDDLYLPIFVGAQNSSIDLPYQPDNQGKNISSLNPYYNELTAQYWAWKNLKNVDAVGLVHYRRYFSLNGKKGLDNILSKEEIETILASNNAILPTQRNYYIETNYSHYVHAHKKEPLEIATQVILKKYPNYYPELEKVFKRTKAHYFNMFILPKKLFDEYSKWLFDVLEETYKQIDYTNYDDYEIRSLGFISELLLDVWINYNNIKYAEVPFVFQEKQNWISKAGKFVVRKIKGESK
ncbi:MAG: DUF4422 domain-containing protein [Lactobacillaceae bacterium]|jgi:hypothetical protein|nr:DUF4422 domain-containing protein [Lactobacillaceae bacterium]